MFLLFCTIVKGGFYMNSRKIFGSIVILALAVGPASAARFYYDDGLVHDLTTTTTEYFSVFNDTTVNVGDGVTYTISSTDTYCSFCNPVPYSSWPVRQ